MDTRSNKVSHPMRSDTEADAIVPDTLIVWTESTGTDMALSFQEAEGCAAIWDFVSHVQQNLMAMAGPDDALSDDAMDNFANPLSLPRPELSNLDDIASLMRTVIATPQGRDSLSKLVISDDYIRKLVPIVTMAEDLESLDDLHHLCNIMKMLVLLNDTQIIEHVVTDDVVMGVVGALECKWWTRRLGRQPLTLSCRRSRLPNPQGQSPPLFERSIKV